jgi:hypothetical protein
MGKGKYAAHISKSSDGLFFLSPTFFGNAGVYLRRFAALVPEQILYVTQVCAFLQEVCGKGMAQPACGRQRVDARPLPGGIKNVQ